MPPSEEVVNVCDSHADLAEHGNRYGCTGDRFVALQIIDAYNYMYGISFSYHCRFNRNRCGTIRPKYKGEDSLAKT